MEHIMKLGQKLPVCEIVCQKTQLSYAEIQKIIATGTEHMTEAKVGVGEEGMLKIDHRKSQVSWWTPDFIKKYDLDDTMQKIYDAVNYVNDEFYQFDLLYIMPLQFTQYSENDNGFYHAHTDCGDLEPKVHRKLSFIIFLNDMEDYEGGDFIYYPSTEGVNTSKERSDLIKKGNMIVFPSYLLHEVTAVTKGTRYSLVGWCEGPRFK